MQIQETTSGGGHERQGCHHMGYSGAANLSVMFSYLGCVLGVLVFIIFSLHGKDMLQAHLKKALVSSTRGKPSVFFPSFSPFCFLGMDLLNFSRSKKHLFGYMSYNYIHRSHFSLPVLVLTQDLRLMIPSLLYE